MIRGFVTEIYPTIQGEGLFTGEKQVFVRLAGCPMRCDYCDTPGSLTADQAMKMSAQEVCDEVRKICWRQNINVVSVTGGEPLIQVEFLEELLPMMRADGFSIHLETAGVHHQELKKIVNLCDVISMDIKLPSATGLSFWLEHKKFLEIGGEKIFTKVVLESHSRPEEIQQVIELLSQFPKPPFLIFQVVTPHRPHVQSPDRHEINGYVQAAKEKLPQVMVMTQKHKEWAIP